jgi:hypothetical protein
LPKTTLSLQFFMSLSGSFTEEISPLNLSAVFPRVAIFRI